jgi:hypothetical protein
MFLPTDDLPCYLCWCTVQHNRTSAVKLTGTCVQLILADAPRFEDCRQAAHNSTATKIHECFQIALNCVDRQSDKRGNPRRPVTAITSNLFLLNGGKHGVVTSRWQTPHVMYGTCSCCHELTYPHICIWRVVTVYSENCLHVKVSCYLHWQCTDSHK